MLIVVGGVAVIFLFLVLVSALQRANDTPEQKAAKRERAKSYDATRYLREYCSTLLVSPSSAKFTDDEFHKSVKIAPEMFLDFGVVESQNKFGVWLRRYWRGIVRLEDGHWRMLYFELGETEIGQLPEEFNKWVAAGRKMD